MSSTAAPATTTDTPQPSAFHPEAGEHVSPTPPTTTPQTDTLQRTNGRRLDEATIGRIISMLASGDYSLREIARECKVDHTTVRKYAKRGGVPARSKLQLLADRIVDANEHVLAKSYEALRRMRPKDYMRLGVAGLSRQIERHSEVLLGHVERDRLRNAPAPTYKPQPVLFLVESLFAGAQCAGQPVTHPVEDAQVVDA